MTCDSGCLVCCFFCFILLRAPLKRCPLADIFGCCASQVLAPDSCYCFLCDLTSLSASALCEIAVVSRSGYYRWVSAEDVRMKREEQDRADFELILTAYNFRGYKKGVLSINMWLLHMGVIMNPKKIQRLKRKYNLLCPIRKPNPYRRMAKALKIRLSLTWGVLYVVADGVG